MSDANGFKVGAIVARVEAFTVLFRITSTLARETFRVLPYRRRGGELVLYVAANGRALIGDGSQWKIINNKEG